MTVQLVTWGLVLAVGGLGVVMLVRRALQVRALAEHGRVTRGRVLARRKRARRQGGGSTRRVQLAYERPDTGERRRWIGVSAAEWERLTEGTEVDLVYLPENPGVFAQLELINQARQAKGLAPLRR